MTTSTMKENVNVLREKLSGGSIRFTTDYSIFKKHPQNREVQRDSAKFKQLLASVKEEDRLSSNPILVDKELYVFNGQHRLEVAKVLGKAIYYLSLIHISEPTRQAEISYAVFCLKKK